MQPHNIVSREEWIEARKAHLAHEKEFTRARDRLSEERRALPWVKVDKDYVFDGPDGQQTLADLFAGRSQLVVQHFMFAPDWNEGCKSCSFWADGFERMIPHLAARDTTLVAISRAPLPKLAAFKAADGLDLRLAVVGGKRLQLRLRRLVHAGRRSSPAPRSTISAPRGFGIEEAPGISVFYRDEAGNIFHTYSCFARGLDMMNAAYHYLDLTPLGRHEEGLPYPMDWVRLRDQYHRRRFRHLVAIAERSDVSWRARSLARFAVAMANNARGIIRCPMSMALSSRFRRRTSPPIAACRRKCGKVWREYGALDYREWVADDVKVGKLTSFPRSVKLKPGETVVFSWITYKSRAQRDRINAKVMADPRLDEHDGPEVDCRSTASG